MRNPSQQLVSSATIPPRTLTNCGRFVASSDEQPQPTGYETARGPLRLVGDDVRLGRLDALDALDGVEDEPRQLAEPARLAEEEDVRPAPACVRRDDAGDLLHLAEHAETRSRASVAQHECLHVGH